MFFRNCQGEPEHPAFPVLADVDGRTDPGGKPFCFIDQFRGGLFFRHRQHSATDAQR